MRIPDVTRKKGGGVCLIMMAKGSYTQAARDGPLPMVKAMIARENYTRVSRTARFSDFRTNMMRWIGGSGLMAISEAGYQAWEITRSTRTIDN